MGRREVRMKRTLLGLNNAYTMFGTTVYVGVLWALRFFWYPGWRELKVDNYHGQFIPQTTRATKFFTVVVPIMYLTLLIQTISEWKGRFRWVPLAGLACLTGSTVVGQRQIIPINKKLDKGIKDQDELTGHLKEWMRLNDQRFVMMTVMWGVFMWYFTARAGKKG
jgi:hypothetical protein